MRRVSELWSDSGAMVAVEFGLIAPVMLAMWLGTIEACYVLRASEQLYTAAEAAANVAANEFSTGVNGDITGNNNICNAAKLAMYPYPTAGKLTIAIGSVSNTSTATQPAFYVQFGYVWVDNWTVDWTNGTNVLNTGSCAADATAAVTNPAALSAGTTPSSTYYQPLVPNARDSVLVVQATYNYSFSVGYNFPGSMTLSSTVYTRPRNGSTAAQ